MTNVCKKRILTLAIVFFCLFGIVAQSMLISNKEPSFIEEGETAIIVESKTPKLKVYLNGIYQGKTRLKVSNVVPGVYFLELKKGDDSLGRVTITIRENYVLTYTFDDI